MVETPLRERGPVLVAARGCLERARAGRGGTLLIVGEAGLGKTSVLDWACGQACTDMDVAVAAGEEIERSLAFGVVHRLLDALGEAELIGTGGSRGPAVESSAPYYRVLSWLQARAGRPLLVAVDDLQWADEDSVRLLAFLARRIEWLPVALIVALRPWPAQAYEVFRPLAPAGVGVLEHLRPLSRPAAAAVLSERLSAAVSEETEDRAWELCAGNPLLVGQVAVAIAQGEQLPSAGSGPGAGAGFASSLLLSRFAGLDADGLACARAGSVLGTVFRPELAVEVAGLAGGRGDAVLEAIVRSGLLLDSDGARMRFAHPLFAEALYGDLPAPVRRRLHERAFRLLAGRGLEAEAAAHAMHAELVGDRQASAVLERVGRSALAAGAFVSATLTLTAALAASGERSRTGVSVALAEALVNLGRVDEGLALLDRVLTDPGSAWRERHAALHVRGRGLMFTGVHDAAGVASEEAIALAIENGRAELAVEPLLDACLTAWVDDGPARAVVFARRARDLAADAPAGLRERAQAMWGRVALESGDEDGLAAIECVAQQINARGAARGAAFPEEFAVIWGARDHVAVAAWHAERFEEAERAYRLVQAQADRAGAVGSLSALLAQSARLLIRRGRLEDALADAERCAQVCELFPPTVPYAWMSRAEALVWLGRMAESEASCQRAEQTQTGIQWWDRLLLAQIRGQRLLWQGDQAAADCFAQVEELSRGGGMIIPTAMEWVGHAVAAYLAVDRVEDAWRVVAFLEDRIAATNRLPCRGPNILAHTARAALAARDGDHAQADRHYDAALALHAEVELPLLHVETLLAYGAFSRRNGRYRDARAPLGEAQHVAEALGAAWLAETARRELQLAGGRRRRRSADRDHLTTAERSVAELAARGHTNAEIARQLYLSLSTIETHLRHIYSKLGIRSRRELQALAPGFQPPQPGEQPERTSASLQRPSRITDGEGPLAGSAERQ